MIDADGLNQTRLTQHAARDMSSVWSPGGTKIIFCSTRGGNFEVYVMDADGANQVRLNDEPPYYPLWYHWVQGRPVK